MNKEYKTVLGNNIKLYITLITIIITASCVNTRKATYFNGVIEAEYKARTESLEPIIKKNDLLSISVSSLNPEAAKVFNVSNASATQASTATGTTTQASGYLVDQEGYISFPMLGKISAAEKTKKELRDEITNLLISKKLLLEPIVDIRYLNYEVSVLGEVSRPSVITIPNEKVTLLEAIGLAGDLTIYAKRDNILLIREEDGKKTLKRIDLTTEEIFNSPYYHLRSGDIIYIEPNKSKIASAGRTHQWLPVVLSALSVIVISLDRFIQ